MLSLKFFFDTTSPKKSALVAERIFSQWLKNNFLGENSAATGVVLTDAFPSALTLVSIQSSQGSCALANGRINCRLGTLGVNASANITMAANVNAAGFIGNQFAASAIESDPDTVNNSATVNVTATASCAQSVTTPIEITRSQWRRDERSGQDELILTIRNRADSIAARLSLAARF